MLRRHFPHVLAVLERRESVAESSLRAEWRAFADAVGRSTAAFVVDGALSFAAGWPLLAADRPNRLIVDELRRLAEVCTALNPHVVHLTGDAGRLARASYADRGPSREAEPIAKIEAMPYQRRRRRLGADGVSAFLHDAQRLMRTALEAGGWRTLTVDVNAATWDDHRQRVLRFLGDAPVPVVPPVIASDRLSANAGEYTGSSGSSADTMIEVVVDGASLVLRQPGRRIGSLQPVTPARFHLVATPLDVEFVATDGAVRHLLLIGQDRMAARYERRGAGDGDGGKRG